eukprot:TRINITY_DN6794_c0_g1_i1.p1 TRINITY_DN6794_c0_g1~~TRINITY_DN6794_c0_g1_i1.p1  ORF type:complete len:789 (+),score=151.89 TRINITY_DN6794_c0_g1_i1:20-2386(+)
MSRNEDGAQQPSKRVFGAVLEYQLALPAKWQSFDRGTHLKSSKSSDIFRPFLTPRPPARRLHTFGNDTESPSRPDLPAEELKYRNLRQKSLRELLVLRDELAVQEEGEREQALLKARVDKAHAARHEKKARELLMPTDRKQGKAEEVTNLYEPTSAPPAPQKIAQVCAASPANRKLFAELFPQASQRYFELVMLAMRNEMTDHLDKERSLDEARQTKADNFERQSQQRLEQRATAALMNQREISRTVAQTSSSRQKSAKQRRLEAKLETESVCLKGDEAVRQKLELHEARAREATQLKAQAVAERLAERTAQAQANLALREAEKREKDEKIMARHKKPPPSPERSKRQPTQPVEAAESQQGQFDIDELPVYVQVAQLDQQRPPSPQSSDTQEKPAVPLVDPRLQRLLAQNAEQMQAAESLRARTLLSLERASERRDLLNSERQHRAQERILHWEERRASALKRDSPPPKIRERAPAPPRPSSPKRQSTTASVLLRVLESREEEAYDLERRIQLQQAAADKRVAEMRQQRALDLQRKSEQHFERSRELRKSDCEVSSISRQNQTRTQSPRPPSRPGIAIEMEKAELARAKMAESQREKEMGNLLKDEASERFGIENECKHAVLAMEKAENHALRLIKASQNARHAPNRLVQISAQRREMAEKEASRRLQQVQYAEEQRQDAVKKLQQNHELRSSAAQLRSQELRQEREKKLNQIEEQYAEHVRNAEARKLKAALELSQKSAASNETWAKHVLQAEASARQREEEQFKALAERQERKRQRFLTMVGASEL